MAGAKALVCAFPSHLFLLDHQLNSKRACARGWLPCCAFTRAHQLHASAQRAAHIDGVGVLDDGGSLLAVGLGVALPGGQALLATVAQWIRRDTKSKLKPMSQATLDCEFAQRYIRLAVTSQTTAKPSVQPNAQRHPALSILSTVLSLPIVIKMCCFLAAAEPLCNRPPGPGCMACRRLPRRAVGPPPGARLQTPRSRRCCAGPSCAEPSGASGSGAEPSSRSSRKSAIGQLGRPSPHGNEPRQAAVGNFNLGQLWRRARTHTNVHTHTHT